MTDVLHADVDALLEIAVTDDFVEDDTDCARCDVVDYTGFAMVDFVGLRKGCIRVGCVRKSEFVV